MPKRFPITSDARFIAKFWRDAVTLKALASVATCAPHRNAASASTNRSHVPFKTTSGVRWTDIARLTLENHRTAAHNLGAPYVRASSSAEKDGEWCGKFRAVQRLLRDVPRGAWLLFLDADAAFRCRGNVTASLHLFSRRRASLVVGNRFGIFAVRHDKWALGWLDRMATALETRPLLCVSHRWPENAATRTATTRRDACRTVVAPRFAGANFRHLAGTTAKRQWNTTTSGGFEEETACLRSINRLAPRSTK